MNSYTSWVCHLQRQRQWSINWRVKCMYSCLLSFLKIVNVDVLNRDTSHWCHGLYEFFITKCEAPNVVQSNEVDQTMSIATAKMTIESNIAKFCWIFVVSKDALVEKDQLIKERNVLSQQNQALQQNVDAVQKDQAEKNKVSSNTLSSKCALTAGRKTSSGQLAKD